MLFTLNVFVISVVNTAVKDYSRLNVNGPHLVLNHGDATGALTACLACDEGFVLVQGVVKSCND